MCSTFNSISNEDGVISTNNENRTLRALVDRKFRSTNPDGLDSEKYVTGLCNILYSIDPMKYPYLAGLSNYNDNSHMNETNILKIDKSKFNYKVKRTKRIDQKLDILEKGVTEENYVNRWSKNISDSLSLQTTGGITTLVNPDVDIGENYEQTTAAFVKRTIRSSDDSKVKENREEMLRLINTIALSEEIDKSSNPNHVDNIDSVNHNSTLETRCIDLFNEWVGKSKLGLGYLFFLTKQKNEWGDEFITKVVRHMSPRIGELNVEEVVMLLLMMFFRRTPWNEEEIYEVLDPTLLQKKLTAMIESTKGVSDAELCAICLGLRRITDFNANIDKFRDSLYMRMRVIGDTLSSEKALTMESSHINAMNMAVIQISVLLQQGYHMGARDPAKNILKMLKCYEDAVIAYDENGVSKESSHGRFLMESRAASKIMMFASSKGGLHNKEVTSRVIERLMLGKHIRHLSLRDMVSFLKFLGQVKEFGTYSETSEFQISDVAKSVLCEIRDMTNESDNDLFFGLKDVMLILQSWLYLSSFDQFDIVNIRRVMDAVKELPQDLFEQNSSLDLKEQNVALGKILSEACYKALYPMSYTAYIQQDVSKREILSPIECEQFTRLISAMDRTIKIYLDRDVAKELLLNDEKIKPMILLNQSKVPAIFYKKTKLPATINLTRRQQLVHAVYKGLLAGLEHESYLKIVHILPHFQEPDIVFGHIAGNIITYPSSMSEMPDYEVKPAPEIGEWTVISVDSPSSTARDLKELAKTGEYSPEHANPERHRQLMRLGYQIYPLSAHDQKQLIRGNNEVWGNRILANILTGNVQGDPKARGVPVL